MKYYFDTEFIEYPCTIDLISIGIICEDGRSLYMVSKDFDENKASEWVKKNVLSQIDFNNQPIYSNKQIKEQILIFIGRDIPEFWAYYADYDWVVFCWLFGSMINLPKGWPMYCKDIKQLADSLGNPTLPEQEKGHHNALEDAKWNKLAHEFLNDKKA